MDVDLRASLVGFALAAVVLAAVGWLVGPGRVADAVVRADPVLLAAVLVAAACWLTSWGLALWTVLGGLGAPVRGHVAVLVFAAATFANNVTPFGQAGGEPVSALFVSRAADTKYETGLAAIASVDSLNFVPSIALATAGIAYFSTRLTFGSRLRLASYAVGALALAVPLLVVVGWRYRHTVEQGAVRAATPVARLVGRLFPGREPPSRAAVRSRVDGFVHAIERATGNRRRLALALGFSTSGWLCQSVSLWLSLTALGANVPFPVALVAVPVGAIAGVTPLPGGLGGVETVLIALLAALSVPASAAAGAVVVHRVGTCLLPTVLGGGVAGVLGSSGRFGVGS